MEDSICVCIVESDLDTLKLVGVMLQRAGYRIVAARSGAQALEAIAANSPEVVLCGPALPDRDGFELIRRIRHDSLSASLAVVVFAEESYRADGFAAGADAHVTKPAHPVELRRRIQQEAVRRWPTPEDLVLSRAWRAEPGEDHRRRLAAEFETTSLDPDRASALVSLFALEIGDRRYLDRLLEGWGSHLPEVLRGRAVALLAYVKHPSTEPILRRALADPAPAVRLEAVRTASRRAALDGSQPVFELLMERLRQGDAEEHRLAIQEWLEIEGERSPLAQQARELLGPPPAPAAPAPSAAVRESPARAVPPPPQMTAAQPPPPVAPPLRFRATRLSKVEAPEWLAHGGEAAVRVCIVDDDLDTLKLVGLMLQRMGYQVTLAYCGAQALAITASGWPDVILCDVMMPDMDGYELIRRIRTNPLIASLAILAFTAKSQVDDKIAGFEAGADDYVTKPAQPAELNERIRQVVRRRWLSPESLALSRAWRAEPTAAHRQRLLVEFRDPATTPEREAALLSLFVLETGDRQYLDDLLGHWGPQLPDALRAGTVHLLANMTHPSTMSILRQALVDPVTTVCLEAIRTMYRHQVGPDILELILGRLAAPSTEVRLAAIRALGDFAWPAAAGSLGVHIHRGGLEERRAVVEALGWIRSEGSAAELLAIACDAGQAPDLRVQAVRALGNQRPTSAFEPLLELLARELQANTPGLRLSLVEALDRYTDRRAMPVLAKVIESARDDPRLVERTCEALAHLNDKHAVPALLQALEHEDAEVVAAAVQALAPLTAPPRMPEPKQVEHFVRQTLDSPGAYHGSLIAVLPALKLQPEFEQEWLAELASRDPARCGRAVVRLALQHKTHAPETQSPACATFCANVRHSLPSFALPADAYRHWAAFAPIMRALAAGRDEQNWQLANLGSSYETPPVCAAALAALGQNRDAAAFDAAVRGLQAPAPEVRRAAAEALGQLQDARCVPALAALLGDSSRSVVLSCALALASLDAPEAVAVLGTAMHAAPKDTRVDIAIALGKSASPAALDRLLQALDVEDDPQVLCALLDSVEKVGDARAIPHLMRLEGHAFLPVTQSVARVARALESRSSSSAP